MEQNSTSSDDIHIKQKSQDQCDIRRLTEMQEQQRASYSTNITSNTNFSQSNQTSSSNIFSEYYSQRQSSKKMEFNIGLRTSSSASTQLLYHHSSLSSSFIRNLQYQNNDNELIVQEIISEIIDRVFSCNINAYQQCLKSIHNNNSLDALSRIIEPQHQYTNKDYKPIQIKVMDEIQEEEDLNNVTKNRQSKEIFQQVNLSKQGSQSSDVSQSIDTKTNENLNYKNDQIDQYSYDQREKFNKGTILDKIQILKTHLGTQQTVYEENNVVFDNTIMQSAQSLCAHQIGFYNRNSYLSNCSSNCYRELSPASKSQYCQSYPQQMENQQYKYLTCQKSKPKNFLHLKKYSHDDSNQSMPFLQHSFSQKISHSCVQKNEWIMDIKRKETQNLFKNSILKQGYLYKKSPKKLVGWQKRYFYLYEDKIIYRKKDNKEKYPILGCINIQHINCKLEDSHDKYIDLNVNGNRTYKFKAQDAQEAIQWHQMLLGAILKQSDQPKDVVSDQYTSIFDKKDYKLQEDFEQISESGDILFIQKGAKKKNIQMAIIFKNLTNDTLYIIQQNKIKL